MTKDRRRSGTYDELRPVVEELYMRGVPLSVIAEAFQVPSRTLYNLVYRFGLFEVRTMRDKDLALDALEKWRVETTEEGSP